MLELGFPKSCPQLSEATIHESESFVLSGCQAATWTLTGGEIQPISYGLPTLDSTGGRGCIVARYNKLQFMAKKPTSAKRLASARLNGSEGRP